MATDHVFPADQDTNDAANFAQFLGRQNLTDYVESGMSFTPDYGVPELTIGAGKAYVRAASMYANKADVTRPQGVDILVEKTQTTVSLTDNDVNYIFVDANLDLNDTASTDDQPQFVAKTTDSRPSDESIKIGEVDTSADTFTLTNRDPDGTFNRLVASTLDARVETNVVSANYTTDGESIIFVDSSGGAVTITLASDDVVDGKSISVIDFGGAAATNNITINTEASENIDGESSITIASNYGGSRVSSDGTNWYTEFSGSVLSVSDSGSTILDSPSDINFDNELDVSNDGDNTLTVDLTSSLSDSTQVTLTGGSIPAHDSTITTSLNDQTVELDVIVTPASNESFSYEYNWDWSKGYNGTSVTVGLTVNWDDDPGSGNDITADVSIRRRDR